MNTIQTNPKILIVLLWITVMFNMVFADIFSIIIEIVDGNVIEIPLDSVTMMGVAAVLTNIPILMIVLSWVLPHRFNKLINIIAAIYTILYIVGGATLLPHYLIMGGIEVIILTTIIIICFRWKV